MKQIILISLLFIYNICTAQTTFKNERLGFSINQPNKWIVAEEGETVQNLEEHIKLDKATLKKLIDTHKGTYQVVTFFKYPINSRHGVIPTIKIVLKNNGTASFEDFKKSIERSFSGMKDIFPDFKFIEQPTVKYIDGKQCVFAMCDYTLTAHNGQEKVKIMVYAVPVNDSFYQITFMDSEKEDNSKLFEKIVESIEIEE